jgi:hypothetical protein
MARWLFYVVCVAVALLTLPLTSSAMPIEKETVENDTMNITDTEPTVQHTVHKLVRYVANAIIRTHAIEPYVNKSNVPENMYRGVVGMQYVYPRTCEDCRYYCQAIVAADVAESMVESFLLKYFPMNSPRKMHCARNGCIMQPHLLCNVVNQMHHEEF